MEGLQAHKFYFVDPNSSFCFHSSIDLLLLVLQVGIEHCLLNMSACNVQISTHKSQWVKEQACFLAQGHPSLLSPCHLSRQSWVHKIKIQNLGSFFRRPAWGFHHPLDDLNSCVPTKYKNWEVNRKTPLLGSRFFHLG